MKEKKAEEERLKQEEEELQKRKLEEKQERKQRKKDKKRIVYDEKIGGGDSDYSDVNNVEVSKEEIFKQPSNANQIWTDVDLAKLTKLIKKYPAGTPERWERIADIMERQI